MECGWCAGGGSWPSNLRADSHLCTMLGDPPLQHLGREEGWEGVGERGGGGELRGGHLGRGGEGKRKAERRKEKYEGKNID